MLRNTRHRDAIELIPPHSPGGLLPVEVPVLRGSDVLFKRQAALCQELRKNEGLDPEGPLLPSSLEGGEELLRADERLRVLEHRAMNVGEQELAPWRRSRTPAQGGIDSGFGEVVRHAFPEEESACRLPVASDGHRLLELTLIEICGDEANMLREYGEGTL